MKKMILTAIALTFLAQGAAGAEPDVLVGARAVLLPTDRAIYLRAEPSASAEALCEITAEAKLTILAEVDETYTRVNYQGRRGYVPSNVLDYLISIGGLSVFPDLQGAQRESLESFLTAFTRIDFAELTQGAFYLTDAPDSLLAEFAVGYVYVDAPGEIEVGDCADGDARLPVSALAPVIERYFGVAPNLDAPDGYVYFRTSDVQANGGAASLTNILDYGNGNYTLYFNVYDAEAALIRTGRASVHADSLDDPAGFTLSSLAVDSK